MYPIPIQRNATHCTELLGAGAVAPACYIRVPAGEMMLAVV